MSTWHPLLNLIEAPVGTWRLADSLGREYLLIELRRVDGQPRYRVSFRGQPLGYATSLRLASERGHDEFIRGHGPSGGPNARQPSTL